MECEAVVIITFIVGTIFGIVVKWFWGLGKNDKQN